MVDASSAVSDAIYRLGYQSLADAQASAAWVTPAELYQLADDAAKYLSYQVGVFIGVDASIEVTAGVGVYALESNHVFTILAWMDNQILRPTPVGALFALDGAWSTTTGDPTRYSLDAGSVGTITLYPVPVAGGELDQICQEFPDAVSSTAPQISDMPSVLQDYLTYAMLAGARGKESDAAMPEMAAHFRERLKLYEQVMESYFGPGQ